jgi:hypothetical protein
MAATGNRLHRVHLRTGGDDLKRGWILGVAVATALLVAPASAYADYWNVYTGYLPDGAGIRYKTTASCTYNPTTCQFETVTMQWPNPSQKMFFLLIDSGGNWTNITASTSDGYTQSTQYQVGTPGWVRGGCHNPAGLSTVWVNCRNGDQIG